MDKRYGHVAKSKKQQELYQSHIRKLDYEPTKDEEHDFKDSSDPEIDENIDYENNGLQKEPFGKKFERHFKKNIFQWIIGIIITILSVFFLSYTWILAETKTIVTTNKDSIDSVIISINKLDDKIISLEKDIKDDIETIANDLSDMNIEIIDRIHKNELEIERLRLLRKILEKER